jgi:hypothetical protein
MKLRERRQLLRTDAFAAQEQLPHLRVEPDDRGRPRWLSGISWLDMGQSGFTGVATLVGFPKLGKSMVCLRSALLAAEARWRVFYFDGENQSAVISSRIRNHFDVPYAQWPSWMEYQFHARHMSVSCTIEAIADHVAEMITEDDDRVLVVIDSINRLAKSMDLQAKRPGKYLNYLNAVVSWAAVCSSSSHGKIAFMLVSETNRAGSAVGMNVEFASDFVLYLRKGGGDHMVKLELLNRDGPGGDLGEYERDWSRCGLFEPGAERHWTDREEDGENEPPPFKPDPDLGF